MVKSELHRDSVSNAVCVTYSMNRLENIKSEKPLFTTLNPFRPPRAGTLLHSEVYHHAIGHRLVRYFSARSRACRDCDQGFGLDDRFLWTRIFVQPIDFQFAGYTLAADRQSGAQDRQCCAYHDREAHL